jgi:peptidoglycan/LPS O-acetylase OafA/YrhL
MTFATFVRVRLLRLAPLYMAGLLLGYAGMLLATRDSQAPVTALQATQALLLGAAGLPWFNTLSWPFDGHTIAGAFYPLNDPSWSLAFELLANAAFFWWVARRGTISSGALVAAAMAAFIVGSLFAWQFNPGFGQANYVLGFPRVIGEFFLGALMLQLGLHRRTYPAWAVVSVCALCFALMLPDKRGAAIVNSWLIVPLVVPLLASVRLSPAGLAAKACRALGELSYPLYVLHVPVCRLVYELMPRAKEMSVDGMMIEVSDGAPVGRVLISAAAALVVSGGFAVMDIQLRGWIAAREKRRSRVQPVGLSQPPDSGMAKLA